LTPASVFKFIWFYFLLSILNHICGILRFLGMCVSQVFLTLGCVKFDSWIRLDYLGVAETGWDIITFIFQDSIFSRRMRCCHFIGNIVLVTNYTDVVSLGFGVFLL